MTTLLNAPYNRRVVEQSLSCIEKGIESNVFESDQKFLVSVSFEKFRGDIPEVRLFGVINTPSSIVTSLEIPFLFRQYDVPSRGIDKSILRVNQNTIKNSCLDSNDIYNLLREEFDAKPYLEVNRSKGCIRIIKSISRSEHRLECISSFARCPKNIAKACSLMVDLHDNSENIGFHARFVNVGLPS